MTRASRRVTEVSLLLVFALPGCATRTEPSSTLEPKLGHSQPHVDASTPEPLATQPDPRDDPVTHDSSASSTETSVVASETPVSEAPPPEPAPAPEPAPTIPPPAPVSKEDETLCDHITKVVLSESNNAAGLNDDQIDELIASCSVALAQDRRKLDEAEFRRRASCVRKASSVAAISACKFD